MSGTPTWQTLANTLVAAANALQPKILAAPNDAAQQALIDQQNNLRNAAEKLIDGAVDGVIAGATGVTATLTQAATDAQAAAATIADIAAAAGLLGALVNLAVAILAAETNPGGVLTAAQGVIGAAKPLLPG